MVADHFRFVAQGGEVVGFVPFLQQGEIGKQFLLLRFADVQFHGGNAYGKLAGGVVHGKGFI